MRKICWIVISLICLTLGASAQETNTIPNLENALKQPALIEQISIDGQSVQLEEFYTRIEEFENLVSVRLIGFENVGEYQRAITNLTYVGKVKTITFFTSNLRELPDNMKELPLLEKVIIMGETPNSNNQYAVDFVNNEGLSRTIFISYYSSASSDEDCVELRANFPGSKVTCPSYESASNAEPFKKEYTNVKPPVEELDIQSEYFKVAPGVSSVLTYETGTEISVPANAFVDKKGNLVTTPVMISYREFRDPLDILVSGIPMTYDSGGVVNTFESAGMFEITASSNGEEVFLTEGSNIDVRFSSTDASSTFNFYSYNDSTGSWDYRGNAGSEDDGIELVSSRANRTSTAFTLFRQREQWIRVRGAWSQDPDTFTLDEMFHSEEYFHHRKVISYGPELPIDRKVRYRDVRRFGYVRVLRHRGRRDREETWFNLGFHHRKFPELRAYNGMVWVCADPTSFKAFRDQYIKRKVYSDIRIEFNESDSTFTIMLKELNEGIVTIKAYPRYRYTGEDGADRAKKRYASIIKRQERYFDRKESKHNKYIAKAKKRYARMRQLRKEELAKLEDERRWAWESVMPQMTKQEKELSYEEWLDYCDAISAGKQEEIAGYIADQNIVYRSLSVDGMGIWNCDQIYRMVNPQTVMPQFVVRDGGEFDSKIVYVIDRSLNGVFQYGPGAITYDKDGHNVLITIDKDNRFAILDEESFLALNNLSRNERDVTLDYQREGITLGELRENLGL